MDAGVIASVIAATLNAGTPLLIAAIGLEVFVGNAPYFATHGYQPVDLRAYLQDAPADGEPIALNDEHSTLTFTGIHQPLYNVALDGVVYQYDGNYPQDQNPLFILWVSGTDEASTAPRQSWQWQAAPRAERSLVRTLDFSGAVDTLTLQAEGYSGEYRSYDLNYTVQAVLANVPRPMDFSLLRLAVVYLALLALWGLRPGAAAWHEAYLTHRAKYRPAVLVLGCMLCLLAAAAPFADARNSGVATSFYNVENWDGESRITFTQHISDWQNDSAAQYGALAHSLLNGRLDLQRDPPAAMAEMQNPYDTAARQSAAPDALWDVAYYQGRYYVYFGIVPCLLFQLPFELLTGVPDLPPSLAMIVMAWLLILAVFGLVRQAANCVLTWSTLLPMVVWPACWLRRALRAVARCTTCCCAPRCMNTPSCAARHLCCWPCGSGCAPPTPRCSTMAKSCCTWRLAACAWRWWRDAAPRWSCLPCSACRSSGRSISGKNACAASRE